MRSRSRDSTSAFWCGVARLVKGKSARLRARRMRVLTTTSDSGPVPRSHSPVVGIRLSRFIGGFLLSDLVAQPGGLFVVLGGHAPLGPVAEPGEGLAAAAVPVAAARHLADVPGGLVDAFQDRLQAVAERLVVGRAAEPALGPEVGVPQAALRAGEFGLL